MDFEKKDNLTPVEKVIKDVVFGGNNQVKLEIFNPEAIFKFDDCKISVSVDKDEDGGTYWVSLDESRGGLASFKLDEGAKALIDVFDIPHYLSVDQIDIIKSSVKKAI